ncbi:hypothetical protein GLOIN_2v1779106 [Rhizophagus irregularis DAOM 181602=DAOM 197198]|nr:hypothetical protein GLOIN_2v1779106 [Rhizophagus irregularis DAOM 181602=DAOM 197198]
MLKSRFNEFLKFNTSCVPSGIVGRSPSRIFKSKAFSKQNEKRINRILSFADSDTSQRKNSLYAQNLLYTCMFLQKLSNIILYQMQQWREIFSHQIFNDFNQWSGPSGPDILEDFDFEKAYDNWINLKARRMQNVVNSQESRVKLIFINEL